MNKPTFLILGTVRSGTTSLYYYLSEHPDVHMSNPKEPRFFDLEYEKGMEFYWKNYFAGWGGEQAVGEARPVKLFLPFVPRRIKQSLPNAKLIAILRNPTDRAFSAWWMHYSRGIDRLSFEDALSEDLERIESGTRFEGEDGEKFWREATQSRREGKIKYRTYLDAGYYAQQIKRYLALFPRSQIKVVFFEDLVSDPESLVRELWQFIGIEATVGLKDRTPRQSSLPAFLLPVSRIAHAARLHKIVPFGVRTRVANLLSKLGKKPQINDTTRKWLIEHYQLHNRELEKIVGRNLSHWDR